MTTKQLIHLPEPSLVIFQPFPWYTSLHVTSVCGKSRGLNRYISIKQPGNLKPKALIPNPLQRLGTPF